jgi:ribosome-binding protein aMBF1 (putative translation factor)
MTAIDSDSVEDEHAEKARPIGPHGEGDEMNERRHEPVFPGFREISERRQALGDELAGQRRALGLSQTQVAARMGTSQSAVARLESGSADVLVSTIDRYASALGWRLEWTLEEGVR